MTKSFCIKCKHPLNKDEQKLGCILCRAKERNCKCNLCMCHSYGYQHLEGLCSFCADGQHMELVIIR